MCVFFPFVAREREREKIIFLRPSSVSLSVLETGRFDTSSFRDELKSSTWNYLQLDLVNLYRNDFVSKRPVTSIFTLNLTACTCVLNLGKNTGCFAVDSSAFLISVPGLGHSSVLAQQQGSFHPDDHHTSQWFWWDCTKSPSINRKLVIRHMTKLGWMDLKFHRNRSRSLVQLWINLGFWETAYIPLP